MQTLGDELLSRPSFADDKDRSRHGGSAAGTLHRIKEGPGLADELVFALHYRILANFPINWQYLHKLDPQPATDNIHYQ